MTDRENSRMQGGFGQVAVQNPDGKTKLIRPKIIAGSSTKGGDGGLGRMAMVRKKKEKLQALLRPFERVTRSRIPKTIEFGYEFTATYKRHTTGGGQVKKIFYNKNIRSFVSYNEKQLHVWREDTGEQVHAVNFFDETQSHQISCIVYSNKYMIYLAISTDFKLHIFNELMIRIGWMPLNVRLIYFAYFYEEESTLITGGIDGCFMFKFNAHTKYDPKQGVMLDPEGHFFNAELGPKVKIEKMPLWIKGLKVLVSQNMIISWSQLKVCFNNLEGKILFRYKKLTNYEDYITDIFVSEKYRYFVSSTYSGQILVWKLKKRKELIHSYTNSHTKTVTCLQEIPNQPTLFISASNDNTVRIFSLDKFTELYCFILPAGVTNINLLSEKIFACFYNSQINVGLLHHLALSFYNSKIEVRKIVKMFKSATNKWNNKCDSVMTLFSDNSVHIQSSDWLDPQMISTIFPPPGAKEVLFCGYSMKANRIILVLLDGTICVYRLEEDGDASILDKIIESKNIKDQNNRSQNQQVTSVTLADTIPPNFDFETNQDTSISDAKRLEETYAKEMANQNSEILDRFLVLGLSKGAVIFLDVNKLDLIYARFFFHRSAVIKVTEMPKRQKFISVCAEMNICVWGFKDLRSNIISFNQMYRPVDQLVAMNDTVLMIFKSGEAQLFKYDEDLEDLVFIRTETSFDHDRKVHDIEVFPKQNLIITGSFDGFAKVWNVKKELIREIKFPEKVYSVSFLNEQGDILVGHHGKVSMVSHEDYNPYEIEKLYNPSKDELDFFYKRKAKLADDDLYHSLKKRDDDIKRQNLLLRNQVQQEQNTQEQQATGGQAESQNRPTMNRQEQRQKSLETTKKQAILDKRREDLIKQKKKSKLVQKGREVDEFGDSPLPWDEPDDQDIEEEDDDDYTDSDYDSIGKQEEVVKDAAIVESKLDDKRKRVLAKLEESVALRKSGDKPATVQQQLQQAIQEKVKNAATPKVKDKAIQQPQAPRTIQPQPQQQQPQQSKYLGQSIPKRVKAPTQQQTKSANDHSMALNSRISHLVSTLPQKTPQPVPSQSSASKVSPPTTRLVSTHKNNSIKDINSLMKAQNRGDAHSLNTSELALAKKGSIASSIENQRQQHNNSVELLPRESSVYATTAIPKEVTEVNYQMAMQKQMHSKHKKNYFTRRDLTLERIQDNVMEHNDPQGQGLEFNSILIGQRSQIELSTEAGITPISTKPKVQAKKEYPSRVKHQIRQRAERSMGGAKNTTEVKRHVNYELDDSRLLYRHEDSILKDNGSEDRGRKHRSKRVGSPETQGPVLVPADTLGGMDGSKKNNAGSTLHSLQKNSVNSMTVQELAALHINDGHNIIDAHFDSLFQTPEASQHLIPPVYHQSNRNNTLSQKNLQILENTKGNISKRLNVHSQSTSGLAARLPDLPDPRIIRDDNPVSLLRRNNRYHVQPMHLYAEQMRQISDASGAISYMLDQYNDTPQQKSESVPRLPRPVGALEKIQHGGNPGNLAQTQDSSNHIPQRQLYSTLLPNVHHHAHDTSIEEITVNVEGKEHVYATMRKQTNNSQMPKPHQTADHHFKDTRQTNNKSALSNKDIEQILRNQDKKAHAYNVPVKASLVARKPPVEFQMPSAFASTKGQQPYKPLEKVEQRSTNKHFVRKQDGENSVEPIRSHQNNYSKLTNKHHLDKNVKSSLNQSVLTSSRQMDDDDPQFEHVIKGYDRSRQFKIFEPKTSQVRKQVTTMNTDLNYRQQHHKNTLDAHRKLSQTSQLGTLDAPYDNSSRLLPTASHAKYNSSQDKFSLDRLSKNDPLATLEALRRQDYQLVKAQELAISHKSHQAHTAILEDSKLTVKGYSQRPQPKRAHALPAVSDPSLHLQDMHSGAYGQVAAPGSSVAHNVEVHPQGFKPSNTLRAASQQKTNNIKIKGFGQNTRLQNSQLLLVNKLEASPELLDRNRPSQGSQGDLLIQEKRVAVQGLGGGGQSGSAHTLLPPTLITEESPLPPYLSGINEPVIRPTNNQSAGLRQADMDYGDPHGGYQQRYPNNDDRYKRAESFDTQSIVEKE